MSKHAELGGETTLSDSIQKEYYDVLSQQEWFSELDEVVLLGSHGRKEGDSVSDLDVWLLLKDTSDLESLSTISSKDMELRKILAQKFNCPNLDRHPASVFNPLEAILYRKIYFTRVGLPYSLGEQSQIIQSDFALLPQIEEYDRVIDWVISINEFLQMDELTADYVMKWKRRIIQDILYYRDNIRLVRNKDLDRIYQERYFSNPTVLRKEAEMLVRNNITKYGIEYIDIQKRENLKTIVTTLEKVRWEFMFGVVDSERYNGWLKGRLWEGSPRRYAFVPYQILDVILQYENLFGQRSFSCDVIKKLNEDCERMDIYTFYRLFTKWTNDALINYE